jgi:hypothetical protein
MNLPVQGRKELLNLLIAAKNNPDRDPSLNLAFGKLRALFPNSVPDPATNKDMANQYKGLLYDSLAAFKKQFPNKPEPNHDDLEKIGKGINIQITQPGMLWGTTQVPIWQADVPPEVAADGAAKGLDQDTVARHYRFALFKKLGFQGAAKTNGKATPTAPPAPTGPARPAAVWGTLPWNAEGRGGPTRQAVEGLVRRGLEKLPDVTAVGPQVPQDRLRQAVAAVSALPRAKPEETEGP